MLTSETLDLLEARYGPQIADWPTEPAQFLVWWHCGYPASDIRCGRGWKALQDSVGVTPRKILQASEAKLIEALRAGGMVPELRTQRLLQIAARIENEFGGDLHSALRQQKDKSRAFLKRFPGIGSPGADRILLFGGVEPVAAVPSNCPWALVRIQHGLERENYGLTYREAQEAIEAEVPYAFEARQRAYLLLKRHGQEICKSKPKCEICPVNGDCMYFSGHDRGGVRGRTRREG